MGLKQLLIILMLFGTGSFFHSLIAVFIIAVFTILNIFFRRFWNEEKTVIYGVVFTGFLSSLILAFGEITNFNWVLENRLFLYSLPIIPIVLLEYKNVKFKKLLKELMIYIEAFLFIALLKELLVNGSIFGIVLFENYEGLLIFNNNSGTLLLIGITMIIGEFLQMKGEK